MRLQRFGNSAMARPKSIAKKNALKGTVPTVTLGTFVQAARLANLLVATLVFLEFGVLSLVNRDGRAFQIGLWLVPFVTVVIWSTASVMCVVALTPRLLCTLGRRLIGKPARSTPSNRSGLWDEWLDSPADSIVAISNVGEPPWFVQDHELSGP
jgi:hypothetical protein